MLNTTYLIKNVIRLLVLLVALTAGNAFAQVYAHNFGTTPITSHPYTAAPSTLDPGLSGSLWSNSKDAWTSFTGSAGAPDQALSLQNSSGTTVINLSLNVASGKQLQVSSFSFWTQRSGTGAQNWSMAINNINVGSGTVPTTGANTGDTTVSNPVSGLTGTVTVAITLTGASGSGTFRIDDFTLNGSVTDIVTCTAPAVTSISPASGPSNTVVDIEGTGFEAGAGTTAVSFNGIDAAGFTVVSDNLIKAVVPQGATTGAIIITTDNCTANTPSFTIISTNCQDGGQTPTELYISELYDQVPNNGGMIEIYNPTPNTITFNGEYVLQRFGNSTDGTPTAGYVLTLTGSIASEDFYLVSSVVPNAQICNAPAANASLGPTGSGGFNDNDKFELLKNNVVIDRIITPSQPGYNMIRKPDAVAPAATYNADDWDIILHPTPAGPPAPLPTNTFCSTLGSHDVNAAPASSISAQPLSMSVCESEQAQFTVALSNEAGFVFQWKRLDASGNWVDVADDTNYSGSSTNTLTINDTPLSFMSNQYYVVATQGSCTLISNAVQLTVSPLPVVIASTTDATCIIPTGSINLTPSVGEGLTYSLNGTDFQTSTTFSNLTPGNYDVTVMSSAGCIAVVPVTVGSAVDVPAVATFTVTQPDCNTTTGTIEITNPIVGLTYSIGGNFGTETTFTNLTPGTYTISAQNLLGCVSVTSVITIDPVPTAPEAPTLDVTQPDCTTAEGSIVVTGPLGAGLTYSINNGPFDTATSFNNLTAGNYTIRVQGAEGCISENSVVLTAPQTPVIDYTVTAPGCNQNNGSITIVPTANPGQGATYSFNGGPFGPATIYNNLGAGTYTIDVQNTNGCTATETIVLVAPDTPADATFSVTDASCGANDGTLTITGPTGNGETYSFNGGPFAATTSFTGLAAGNYTIVVQNSNGCISGTVTATVGTTAAPANATFTVTDAGCTVNNGTITITGPTGNGETYSFNGGPFAATTSYTGLAAGDYTIVVQNAAGCNSATVTATVGTAGAPANATFTVTDAGCTVNNGTITITDNSLNGDTYSFNGGPFTTTTLYTGLAAGDYTIIVQNSNGCTSGTVTATVGTTVAPASATFTVTDAGCTVNNGTITITGPTGNGETYSFNGGPFAATTSFTGLAAGDYTIAVQDVNGCTSGTVTATVGTTAAPANATFTVTDAGCTVNNGTITITGPTGNGETYSFNGGPFGATTSFGGLAAGDYTIAVQDANGCTSGTVTATVGTTAAPANATFTVTDSGCTVNNGTITITGPTGNGETYSFNGGAFAATTSFTGLAAGDYTIAVQDANGCTSGTVTATIFNDIPGNIITTVTSPGCDGTGGSITVTSPTVAGYTYSIDGGPFTSSPTFNNLTAGQYTITVQTPGGCTNTAFVSVTPGATGEPQITGVQGCIDTISGRAYVLEALPLNNSFDVETATYQWTNQQGSPISSNMGNTLNVTQYLSGINQSQEFPMVFNVEVTSAGGCSDTYAFTVENIFCSVQKGISPNNDGKNDSFDLIGLNATKVSIFNRYGTEVFTRSNYRNEWFGQSDNGNELPTGTYYYVIEAPGSSQTGWIYLNREEN